jgi:hypothetical protein
VHAAASTAARGSMSSLTMSGAVLTAQLRE